MEEKSIQYSIYGIVWSVKTLMSLENQLEKVSFATQQCLEAKR